MRRWRRVLWWAVPLVIFAVSRVVDALIIAHAAHHQAAMDGSYGIHVETVKPADPGYLAALTNWDGQWYETIARHGYPRDVGSGPLPQSPWAFFPFFPALVRLVMLITPLGFAVAATIISMTAAALAMVVLYRLILDRGHAFAAVITVVGLSFFPSAPILQAAYPESLALLELVLLLAFLSRREYAAVVPLLVMLALTRPVTLPVAALVGAHGLVSWRASTRRQRWQLAGLTGLAGLCFGLWPLLAGAMSGRWDVYFATERAWGNDVALRQSYLGWLFGGPDHADTARALLVLGVLLISVAVPAARAWPLEMRLWAVLYGLYLGLVLRPGTSIERYMLLAVVPWLPLPSLAPRGTPRWVQGLLIAVIAGIGIRMQVGWVEHFFIPSVSNGTWFPPP